MKKIILLAAFAAAGFLSAKSSVETKLNEKKTELNCDKFISVQECGVFVVYYDAGGYITGSQYFSSDQPDLQSCQRYQSAVKLTLVIAGYWLT
ncbi:hypothetical protein [Chryseobacterium sp.]|uniref:hypothetical protein n=1 Tax=Chryseobacterium sp. TaxID=1871047 RepID=UPI0011C74C0C|nr:hypothetical protein [Chryseobacterium sp.]TXF76256.1 hypothetical protein FUA25_10250 [Chryseobacterium sp.]